MFEFFDKCLSQSRVLSPKFFAGVLQLVVPVFTMQRNTNQLSPGRLAEYSLTTIYANLNRGDGETRCGSGS